MSRHRRHKESPLPSLEVKTVDTSTSAVKPIWKRNGLDVSRPLSPSPLIPGRSREAWLDLSLGDDGQQPGHDRHQHGTEAKDEVQGDVGDESDVRAGEDPRDEIHPGQRAYLKSQVQSHAPRPASASLETESQTTGCWLVNLPPLGTENT